MAVTATATPAAATEKQVKYLRHLIMKYYCEPYQREDRDNILSHLRDNPRLRQCLFTNHQQSMTYARSDNRL